MGENSKVEVLGLKWFIRTQRTDVTARQPPCLLSCDALGLLGTPPVRTPSPETKLQGLLDLRQGTSRAASQSKALFVIVSLPQVFSYSTLLLRWGGVIKG